MLHLRKGVTYVYLTDSPILSKQFSHFPLGMMYILPLGILYILDLFCALFSVYYFKSKHIVKLFPKILSETF